MGADAHFRAVFIIIAEYESTEVAHSGCGRFIVLSVSAPRTAVRATMVRSKCAPVDVPRVKKSIWTVRYYVSQLCACSGCGPMAIEEKKVE